MEDGENRTVSPADSPESTEASVFQQERAPDDVERGTGSLEHARTHGGRTVINDT